MKWLLPSVSLCLVLQAGTALEAQGRRRPVETPSGGQGRRITTESLDRRSSSEQARRGTPERAPGNRSSFHRGPVASAPIVTPRYLRPCITFPTAAYWGQRDLMAEIQWHARRGFVPVVPVSDEVRELSGSADMPAGWKVYGFVVPPGGKLHVRLHHPNEGWFRLSMVNKWGDLEAGMLQNIIYTGNPEARYTNPNKEARAVYVIVDDPGWMSSRAYPYQLAITKDWEPNREDLREVKPVQGIWASNPLSDISAEHGAQAALVW